MPTTSNEIEASVSRGVTVSLMVGDVRLACLAMHVIGSFMRVLQTTNPRMELRTFHGITEMEGGRMKSLRKSREHASAPSPIRLFPP